MTALALAEWAHTLRPDPADLELAGRSLRDTVAVALAASDHPVTQLAAGLPDGARWAVAAHVLDFDDLHMESTTHISALCVPAALATGGGARGYLAAAGVMARLGTALGWPHYSAGWHATCTAGAPACAAGAAVALGLDPERIATAIALAIPGAGGVQRAFGTDAKSLQAGFAVDAGLRAAALTDEAVRRRAARRLAGLVETELSPGGSWLLEGELVAEVHADGEVLGVKQQFPPGAPQRPPAAAELHAKLTGCVAGLDADPSSWTWDNAAGVLARVLPAGGRR